MCRLTQPMRVLTVRPPWAQMIVGSFKHVENRTRNLAGDYRGLVAIHAGQREDTDARAHPEVQRIAREYWGVSADSLFVGEREQFGHIIGVANLWAVHQHDGSASFNCCPNAPDRYARWAEPGKWHMCFSVPRKLAKPIPFTGALGLRRLDEDMTARILAAIA